MSMQRICNYGSFLQAYGLKKIFEELVCRAEFVDYHVDDCLLKADGNRIKRKIAKTAEVFKCQATIRDKLRYTNYKINYYLLLEIIAVISPRALARIKVNNIILSVSVTMRLR